MNLDEFSKILQTNSTILLTNGEYNYYIDTSNIYKFYNMYMNYLEENSFMKLWVKGEMYNFDLQISLSLNKENINYKYMKNLFDKIANSLPMNPDIYINYFFLFYRYGNTIGIYSPNMILSNGEMEDIENRLHEVLTEDDDDDNFIAIKMNMDNYRVLPGCIIEIEGQEYEVDLLNYSANILYKDYLMINFLQNFNNIPNIKNHYMLSEVNLKSNKNDMYFNFIPRYEFKRVNFLPQHRVNMLFSACKLDTKNKFNYINLLDCISESRFDKQEDMYKIILSIERCLSEDLNYKKRIPIAIRQFTDMVKRKTGKEIDMLNLNLKPDPQYSMRTLMHYARIDNEKQFTQLLGSNIWSKLMNIQNIKGFTDLASAMAMALQPYYIVKIVKVSNGHRILLYEFKDPHYICHNDALTHITYLMRPNSYLYKVLETYIKTLHSKAAISSIENSKYYQSVITIITLLIEKLKEPAYRDKVINEILLEMQHIQKDLHFDSTLPMDNNINLFGVNNGILEICNDKLFFREGMPDDRLTKRSNANYNPDIKNSNKYKFVKDYFRKLFPNESVRLWFLNWIASGFKGSNPKIAVFLIGPTDAGKSTFSAFLQTAFGDSYSGPTVSELFNDPKIGTDAPAPALIKAISNRLTTFEESSQLIRGGPFKNFNGGAVKIRARDLHMSGSSIDVEARFLYLLNSFPGFDFCDAAIYRRSAVIITECRFIDPKSRLLPNNENEQCEKQIFPKDDTFVSNMGIYDDALLYYLTENYTNKNLQELPKLIEEWTRLEFNKIDSLMSFKLNYIYETSWSNIKIIDAYNKAKALRKIHPNVTLELFQNKFQKMFSPKTGVSKSGKEYWLGLKISNINIHLNIELLKFLLSNIIPGESVKIEKLYDKYPYEIDIKEFTYLIKEFLDTEIEDGELIGFELL